MEDSEIVAIIKRERTQMTLKEKIDGALYLWFWASAFGRVLNYERHTQALRVMSIAERIE